MPELIGAIKTSAARKDMVPMMWTNKLKTRAKKWACIKYRLTKERLSSLFIVTFALWRKHQSRNLGQAECKQIQPERRTSSLIGWMAREGGIYFLLILSWHIFIIVMSDLLFISYWCSWGNCLKSVVLDSDIISMLTTCCLSVGIVPVFLVQQMFRVLG